MEINRHHIDPQTVAKNADRLRVQPDGSGSTKTRQQELNQQPAHTQTKNTGRSQEQLRHELHTTSKFDRVLDGKNQNPPTARHFEVRQDHAQASRLNQPSSLEQVRSQNSQIADAQIVQNTQKVSGENQQIRWDNFRTNTFQQNQAMKSNIQHDLAMNSFKAPIAQSQSSSNPTGHYYRFAQSTFLVRA